MIRSGVILAGGQGRRMGGIDKGWYEYEGRPLIETAIARLAPQLDQLIISANRNIEAYQRLGYEVVSDLSDQALGPLAGIEAALQQVQGEAVYVVPCDSPNLPLNLCQQLDKSPAQVAYLQDQQRQHFLHARISKGLQASLHEYLHSAANNGSVRLWYDACQAEAVSCAEALLTLENINHPVADAD